MRCTGRDSTRVMRQMAGAFTRVAPRPSSREPARSGESARAQAPASWSPAGGRRLPPTTRERMEAAFGRGLDDVRIHTDAPAASLTAAHHAHALTARAHLAFAAGRFRPDTGDGVHLLAHELAHVVQQSASDPTPRARASPVVLEPANTPEPANATKFRQADISRSSGVKQSSSSSTCTMSST